MLDVSNTDTPPPLLLHPQAETEHLTRDLDRSRELVTSAQQQVTSSKASHDRAETTMQNNLDEAMALVRDKDDVIRKQKHALDEIRRVLNSEQERYDPWCAGVAATWMGAQTWIAQLSRTSRNSGRTKT